MAALQTFDQALADSNPAHGKEWSDERLLVVGELAAQLTDDELALLRVIWRDRPPIWQKHCAEVLGWARHGEAIELLMDLVDRGRPEVVLAALETLSEFDPELLNSAQVSRIIGATSALLAGPIEDLHRVLLERFLAKFKPAGAGIQ
jgi:hypothetical protein